jgi:hypothetical protein
MPDADSLHSSSPPRIVPDETVSSCNIKRTA